MIKTLERQQADDRRLKPRLRDKIHLRGFGFYETYLNLRRQVLFLRRGFNRRSLMDGALLSCLLAFCFCAAVRAADLSTPPADLTVKAVPLPRLETETLPNGLKIIVAQSHRIPVVTMSLSVNAGSVIDPDDRRGLAEAVAAEMTAGTDTYTSLQIQEQAERMGGSLSASAGYDSTTISASALAPDFPQMTELMADVLLHPTFPLPELGLYQNLTLQMLSVQRQESAFLARQELGTVLYGGQGYGVVGTTPAALQAFTPDILRDFYREHYIPTFAVLVVVGDVTPGAVFQQVEAALGGWSAEKHLPPPEPSIQIIDGPRRVYLIDRPGSMQSTIVIASEAITRHDPDYFPLTVANTILGGGPDSRLFSIVREKPGDAYDVQSSLDLHTWNGSLTESAETRTSATVPVLKKMLAKTALLTTQDVTPAELNEAKQDLAGTFALQVETQAGLALGILTDEADVFTSNDLMAYRAEIDAVTTADVRRVAEKYFHPETASVIVVGDGAHLRDALKSIGPVQEVNPRHHE